MTATPAIEGWFTTGDAPALLGSRCTGCGQVSFPRSRHCPDPACAGGEPEVVELARRGRVWSYTDAQYRPPPPYVPPAGDDAEDAGHRPFAIAAVELTGGPGAGMVVLGQVADGFGVADLVVGAEVDLVVETLYTDESGDRSVWRWRPVGGAR